MADAPAGAEGHVLRRTLRAEVALLSEFDQLQTGVTVPVS